MRQFLVLTQHGKITRSVPPLPLNSTQEEEINDLSLLHKLSMTQANYLNTLGLGYFDIQIVQMTKMYPNRTEVIKGVEPETDTVLHVLTLTDQHMA